MHHTKELFIKPGSLFTRHGSLVVCTVKPQQEVNYSGSIPFLSGVCMFSLYLHGFTTGTLIYSQIKDMQQC